MEEVKIKQHLHFFKIKKCFDDIVTKAYEPKNSSSLAVTRILFGIMMLTDTLNERGGLHMASRWRNQEICYFPLFHQIRTPSFFFMCLLYFIMWLGAWGITLGYKFQFSTLTFIIPYWFILILDKSYWNNHSYLFGIVAVLFLGSSAHHKYSIDSFYKKEKRKDSVPFWNYFILRYQFFILYFLAGLKKMDKEWLSGYSMNNLSRHWVFNLFKIILTNDQIDFLVVHWCGFLLDLTLGFCLLNNKLRPYGMVFGSAFHFMNSRLFSIGVFPYVCLVTMPIFCDYDWPEKLVARFTSKFYKSEIINVQENKITWKNRLLVVLLFFHCFLQGFLPYSHFITKGYNNWTNGLYGYSWDMMVHSWNSALVVVQVKDNIFNHEYYISPDYLTRNDRWNKHGDMCLQYAHCLKENLIKLNGTVLDSRSKPILLSNNFSIYIDVWCSLNGRFQQRMFNPNYDLLSANWSPFKPVEWLLPLLFDKDEFRNVLKNIETDVYSWSNHSDVLFIADFPGMHLENYMSMELTNVTLFVLRGTIVYEIDLASRKQSFGIKLTPGLQFKVNTGIFHKIHTIGSQPSVYMYTYINQTRKDRGVL